MPLEASPCVRPHHRSSGGDGYAMGASVDSSLPVCRDCDTRHHPMSVCAPKDEQRWKAPVETAGDDSGDETFLDPPPRNGPATAFTTFSKPHADFHARTCVRVHAPKLTQPAFSTACACAD